MNHVQGFLDAHIGLLEDFSKDQPAQESDKGYNAVFVLKTHKKKTSWRKRNWNLMKQIESLDVGKQFPALQFTVKAFILPSVSYVWSIHMQYRINWCCWWTDKMLHMHLGSFLETNICHKIFKIQGSLTSICPGAFNTIWLPHSVNVTCSGLFSNHTPVRASSRLALTMTEVLYLCQRRLLDTVKSPGKH